VVSVVGVVVVMEPGEGGAGHGEPRRARSCLLRAASLGPTSWRSCAAARLLCSCQRAQQQLLLRRQAQGAARGQGALHGGSLVVLLTVLSICL
jgi:hypothetical protein